MGILVLPENFIEELKLQETTKLCALGH